MPGITTITVLDAHIRRVTAFALWRIVSSEIVGERALSENLEDLAWEGIHPAFQLAQNAGEAEHRLIRLGAVQAAARAVAGAGEGQRLELPVSREELSEAFRECALVIDQSSELLSELRSEERAHVDRCREAVDRLLEELDDQRRPSGPTPLRCDPLSVPVFAGAPTVRRARVEQMVASAG